MTAEVSPRRAVLRETPPPRDRERVQPRLVSWVDPGVTPWTDLRGGHASRVCRFIERYVILPAGHGRGSPFRLRPWQERDIRRLYGPDREANRAAMLSIARGNGKTGLASALTVAELFLVPGAEVLTVAQNERSAAVPYFRAVESIQKSPELRDHAFVYADTTRPRTLLPGRGAVMFPLPATLDALLGWQPTFVVVDEIGLVQPDTWMAMQSSAGKHPRSLVLGIGTPGYDKGVMWRMRELAIGDAPPPGFAYVEHAAPLDWDIARSATWKRANPALGDFLKPDALALDAATLGAAAFRTFRLGQWADREAAWLPADTWDLLDVVPGPIPDGSPVTLGFDGSVAIDATGLVAYDVATQRLVLLELWERPRGDRRWKVPRADVRAWIERAFSRWNVLALYADPHYFRDMLEELTEQYPGRITEFATNARTRMAAATDRFATAVYNRTLAWDGSDALRRHVLAANAEVTPAGDVIRKRADKPQPIDLAVCAILAVEAAGSLEPEPEYAIY
jgi:phage terminase large subunit-like protein